MLRGSKPAKRPSSVLGVRRSVNPHSPKKTGFRSLPGSCPQGYTFRPFPCRPEGVLDRSVGPYQPSFSRSLSAVERTLVLLKPDAVQRGYIGRILSRFEAKGLKPVGIKLRRFPVELIQKHYEVHRERPFFDNLVAFMTSGPVLAVALEGQDAIEVTRNLMGATNAAKAAPGTIRGDLALSFSNNLVHGSDGPESAATELALFFPDPGELCEWTPVTEPWVYSSEER